MLRAAALPGGSSASTPASKHSPAEPREAHAVASVKKGERRKVTGQICAEFGNGSEGRMW